MVYPNSGHPVFIRAYYGCYDPLAYPVFYPSGETGQKDKGILLEQDPVIRFPRKKRRYTKWKCKYFAHLTFLQVTLLSFYKYKLVLINYFTWRIAAADLATPKESTRNAVDLIRGW